MAPQAILATPKRCKDAKELKERLTAWSLRVAEYEHQFKVTEEALKKFCGEGNCLPIKREFLTGPRKVDEIMETLGIFINETMADDRPVPMDLGNVGTHHAQMTQSGSGTSNDISYDDAGAIAWNWYKAGKGTGKKGTERIGECGIVEEELMN